MPEHSLFDITAEHIAALNDERLERLTARLCEATLRRSDLPATAVRSGGNLKATDGGIDVRVELPADTVISGPVPRADTGFQAKAEKMPQSKINKEMRPKREQGNGATAQCLRPSIRALAKAGGAYVIVSSKDSVSDSVLANRRKAMRTAVADIDDNYKLHLDFYDGSTVTSPSIPGTSTRPI